MRAWLALACLLAAVSIPASFGHGVGFEVLDPVRLGDREVGLEVTSSQSEGLDGGQREIKFSFFDTQSTITVRDVTYEIAASKGDVFLFDGTFKASDGILVIVLKADNSNDVTLERAQGGGLFDALLNPSSVVHATGKPFATGGLYWFDVRITTAGSFAEQLEEPIEYTVGLSLPQRSLHKIYDPYFGSTELSLVTYYDEISSFRYNPQEREISFYMPFNWSAENINETAVVHEELVFPKTFGDLLYTKYDVSVNGVQVPARAVLVDGFSDKQTTLHVVLNRKDLLVLKELQGGEANGMNFVMGPRSGSPLGTVTDNGQFRVTLDWGSEPLRSGHRAVFQFNITDVFLGNTPIAVQYDVSLVRDGATIHSETGISIAAGGGTNEFAVSIPDDSEGLAAIHFDNLDGNRLARAVIPIVIDRAEYGAIVPDWLKASAGFWSEGEIDDQTFANGIEYLIEQGVVWVPAEPSSVGSESEIPGWVRENVASWSKGEANDGTFVDALTFLIESGVIPVPV